MAERKPRGELAELSATLQNLCTAGKRSDKELKTAKRDAFKKVINYMTLGMDMSALFPMMLSCANLSGDDLVLKKMLYLYITHYATHAPDLALLTINQLQKDCRDQDPMVRGLALRSLCSLRVANFLEYVVTPVLSGLEDRHPYVRRTAVMGVLKLAHIEPGTVQHHGLLERVKRLLTSDADSQVVANCLSVLMQLEAPAKLVEKPLIYSMINRIKEFSDWSQCAVLELASHYVPSSEAEVYDVLNALEDRMGHVNSAVVMAAIKVFLHHTINMPATHQQVLERIKDPLKTLISRDDGPTVYAVLSHVLLLAQRAPVIFEADATSFFCRAHDPWYVKKLKMEILAAIACSTNVYDIVSELTEYARDISPTMAREAVRAVGRIALAVPDTGGIVERLLLFLDSGSEHIVAEALVALKDVLRRYPDVADVCVGQLAEIAISTISQADARAAYVWAMGQFGLLVNDAPYLLEPLADAFALEEPSVRLALLTAAVSLFFKRPPECHKLLGQVLAAGIADSHSDVHDRALLYYRLLRANMAEAERVCAPPLMVVNWFSENMSAETKDAIFQEFNSCSVVFQQPAASFIERQAYHSLEPEPEAPGPPPAADLLALEAPELLGADPATNLLADVDGMEGQDLLGDLDVPPPVPLGGGAPQQQQQRQQPLDLLLGSPVQAAPVSGGGYQQQPYQQPQPLYGAPQPYGGQAQQYGGQQQQLYQPAAAAGLGADLMGLGLDDLAGPSLPTTGRGASLASGTAGPGPSSGGMAAMGNFSGAPQYGMQQPAAAAGVGNNLLGLGAVPQAPQQSRLQQQQQPVELHLNPTPRLSAAAFQEEWKRLAPLHQYTLPVSPSSVAAITANSHRDFTQHMTQAYIHTIASGGQPPVFKYYMYGAEQQPGQGGAGPGLGPLYLVEVVLRADAGQAGVTIKAQQPAGLPAFLDLWSTCLTGFLG